VEISYFAYNGSMASTPRKKKGMPAEADRAATVSKPKTARGADVTDAEDGGRRLGSRVRRTPPKSRPAAAHAKAASASPMPVRSVPVTSRRPRPRTKGEAVARLAAADQRLAAKLPLKALGELAVEAEDAAASAASSAGTSPLTGEQQPSSGELRAVRVANLRRSFAERRRLLSDALTVAEVAEMLDVGRQTPHDRRNAGTLLGVKDNGQWRFPAWQFDPEGPDGIVTGLPEAMKALRGPISELGRVRWFVTRKPLLEGRTPIEALRDGNVDDVVAEAEALGAS